MKTDAGRDELEIHLRLDKVVLAVRDHSGSAQTELTPADAREAARLLEDAAANAERTPSS